MVEEAGTAIDMSQGSSSSVEGTQMIGPHDWIDVDLREFDTQQEHKADNLSQGYDSFRLIIEGYRRPEVFRIAVGCMKNSDVGIHQYLRRETMMDSSLEDLGQQNINFRYDCQYCSSSCNLSSRRRALADHCLSLQGRKYRHPGQSSSPVAHYDLTLVVRKWKLRIDVVMLKSLRNYCAGLVGGGRSGDETWQFTG